MRHKIKINRKEFEWYLTPEKHELVAGKLTGITPEDYVIMQFPWELFPLMPICCIGYLVYRIGQFIGSKLV